MDTFFRTLLFALVCLVGSAASLNAQQKSGQISPCAIFLCAPHCMPVATNGQCRCECDVFRSVSANETCTPSAFHSCYQGPKAGARISGRPNLRPVPDDKTCVASASSACYTGPKSSKSGKGLFVPAADEGPGTVHGCFCRPVTRCVSDSAPPSSSGGGRRTVCWTEEECSCWNRG